MQPKPPVTYRPYGERTIDTQYRNLLTEIMDRGTVVAKTQQGEEKRRLFGRQIRYSLENGFPMVTERDLRPYLKQSTGEIMGFINGARTLKALEEFGCRWWKTWITPEKCAKRGLPPGDLGPGSYGAAFHDFPHFEWEDLAGHPDGGRYLPRPFNQIQHVLEQIREMPHLATHIIVPWIPQYLGRGKGKQQKVVVVPCHGLVHIVINDNGKLDLHHFQRSADLPVGVAFNLIHYGLLAMLFAQATGYEVGDYVFTFSDVHIYERQYSYVETLLSRSANVFPDFRINPEITDVFSCRAKDVMVYNYYPGERLDIPTPT